MTEIIKKSTIILENKNFLKITGVEGVNNLTETHASVLVCGEVLEIKGLNLKAELLSVECGELNLSGKVTSLKFEDKKEKQTFLKRIFK